MTENTKKFRSIFLAALVVCSVFAGTFAFAGTAAAEVSSLQVSETTVSPGDSITVDAQASQNESVTLGLDADGNGSISVEETTNVTADASGNVSAELSIPADTEDGNLSVVATNQSNYSAGTAVDQFEQSTSVVVESNESSTTSDSLVFAGQEVVYDAAADDDNQDNNYVLRSGTPDGQSSPSGELSVNEDGVIRIDTSNLETGSYYITNDGPNSADFTFEIMEQQLSVDADSDSVAKGDNATFTVNAPDRRGDFNLSVTSENLSDSELADVFGVDNVDTTVDDNDAANDGDGVAISDVSNTDKIEGDFSNIDVGDYEFNFSVEDAFASDTATISVTEQGEAGADFADSAVTVESGDSDWINVTVENNQSAYLHLGGEDAGYNVTATVVDNDGDGHVNVSLNTFNPQGPNFGLAVPNSGDEIRNINGTYNGQGRLDAGSYEMEVSVNNDGSADAVGTISVLERSTDAASTWVSAPSTLDDQLTHEDLMTAIEENEVVQRSDVAHKDLAVVQIQASGIYGYLQAQGGDEAALDSIYGADDSEPISLYVNHTNPGQNQQANEIPRSALSLYTNDEKNTAFLTIDTSAQGVEAGQNYEVAFEVNDLQQNNPSELNTGEDDQRVTTTFSVVDRDLMFDTNEDDVIEVGAEENATISGKTSIAPNSDIRLYLRSAQGATTPFADSQTVSVSENGTFAAQLDFSGIDVGTNFTVDASTSPSFGESAETSVDGTVVNATDSDSASDECPKADNSCDVDDGNSTDEPTTDNPTTDEPSTDEPSTDEPTTDEPTTDETTTETETPGFGALVAVIALVGAALLAVRRE